MRALAKWGSCDFPVFRITTATNYFRKTCSHCPRFLRAWTDRSGAKCRVKRYSRHPSGDSGRDARTDTPAGVTAGTAGAGECEDTATASYDWKVIHQTKAVRLTDPNTDTTSPSCSMVVSVGVGIAIGNGNVGAQAFRGSRHGSAPDCTLCDSPHGAFPAQQRVWRRWS